MFLRDECVAQIEKNPNVCLYTSCTKEKWSLRLRTLCSNQQIYHNMQIYNSVDAGV